MMREMMREIKRSHAREQEERHVVYHEREQEERHVVYQEREQEERHVVYHTFIRQMSCMTSTCLDEVDCEERRGMRR